MLNTHTLTFVEACLQTVWVLTDPLMAVLADFNPFPVLVISVGLALLPHKGLKVGHRAVIAAAAAFTLQTLMPLRYGLPPIWPDPLMFETYFDLLLLGLIAWGVGMILHYAAKVRPFDDGRSVRRKLSAPKGLKPSFAPTSFNSDMAGPLTQHLSWTLTRRESLSGNPPQRPATHRPEY